MFQFQKVLHQTIALVLVIFSFCASARALDLDWAGQFRAESNWVINYSLGKTNITNDATKSAGNGYYVPGGGSGNAYFNTLFMKLQPSLIVNDNVYIKSEWWVGDPIFGFFGDGVPYNSGSRNFFSNQKRGSSISAHRFWVELLTDLGTIQIGRAPLHWGLGIVWNEGDDTFARYQSTGDLIRLISKFGSFTFSPAFIKHSVGNNIGGTCQDPTGAVPCVTSQGGGSLTDYSIAIKYENIDEDFELGLNFIRRIGGSAQDPSFGYFGVQGATAGINYNTWDLFGRKKIGPVTFAGEVPITTGSIGGLTYSTYAVALESQVEVSSKLKASLKAGRAPGQGNVVAGGTPGSFDAFFFNQGYNIGLIMFNYQLRNFAGPNTFNNPNTPANSLLSPWDNSIVNANYISASGSYKANKWSFRGSFIYASAIEAAAAGTQFFNYWSKEFVTFNGSFSQGKSYGWEMDYGVSLDWDESFRFDLDVGWWFPGDFFRFSNAPTENSISSVFATVMKAGVRF